MQTCPALWTGSPGLCKVNWVMEKLVWVYRKLSSGMWPQWTCFSCKAPYHLPMRPDIYAYMDLLNCWVCVGRVCVCNKQFNFYICWQSKIIWHGIEIVYHEVFISAVGYPLTLLQYHFINVLHADVRWLQQTQCRLCMNNNMSIMYFVETYAFSKFSLNWSCDRIRFVSKLRVRYTKGMKVMAL